MSDLIHEGPKDPNKPPVPGEEKPTTERERMKKVYTYVAILFTVAFLLILWTFLMNQRSINEIKDGNTALQSTLQQNDSLEAHIAELEEQLATAEEDKKALDETVGVQSSQLRALDWLLEIENAYNTGDLDAAKDNIRSFEETGTVEFLLDADMEHFYFMEMNTRIQVEHGITEMITGVDLVRQQLRIASGLPLDLTQEDVTLTGHAIECRINAEDPTANFRPCPGKVEFLHFPGGPGVRVDSALYNGCTLSPYYDSLAAKVMVHAPTRLEAIRKMRRCLEEFTLEGFPTNAELSYELLFHPTFVRGGCTTAFLDRSLPELLEFSRRVDDHKG